MDNFFPDLKTYRNCRKSLRLLVHKQASFVSLKIVICKRIWVVILELVAAIPRVFNIMDEEVYETVVDEPDELAHIKFYRCKTATQGIPKIE